VLSEQQSFKKAQISTNFEENKNLTLNNNNNTEEEIKTDQTEKKVINKDKNTETKIVVAK
jgi:hypothetical protein